MFGGRQNFFKVGVPQCTFTLSKATYTQNLPKAGAFSHTAKSAAAAAADTVPKCCKARVIAKHNKMTGEKFGGCAIFPVCKLI